MKELKYRGWNENKRKFIYFTIFDNDVPSSIIEITSSIEEYIGLKDKNGKEVYEGDIIKGGGLGNQIVCFGEYDNKESYEDHKQGIGFYLKAIRDGKIYGGDAIHWLFTSPEVIGNIYENPELLEGD